jgi:hypothetical protein
MDSSASQLDLIPSACVVTATRLMLGGKISLKNCFVGVTANVSVSTGRVQTEVF